MAARTWWILLSSLLTRFGLEQHPYDKSLWYHPRKPIFVLTHVDDMLVVGPPGTADKLAAFLRKSKEKVETTTEDLRVFLGREYTRREDGTGYVVTVTSKIEELANEYAEHGIPRHVMMPCPSSHDWMETPTESEVQAGRALPFRELMGSLLWIARARPDVRYAVQRLARFSAGWGQKQFKVALRVLGYLIETKSRGTIIEGAPGEPTPECETDASWCDDPYDRKSTLGFTITLGKTIVETGSFVDKSIALASAESEYRAASLGTRKLVGYRNFLKALGWNIKGPSKLWMDNEAARSQIRNAERNLSEFAKHIDIAYHNVRLEFEKGRIDPQHRSSKVLFADCLTKGLSGTEHVERTNASEGMTKIGKSMADARNANSKAKFENSDSDSDLDQEQEDN